MKYTISFLIFLLGVGVGITWGEYHALKSVKNAVKVVETIDKDYQFALDMKKAGYKPLITWTK